MFDKLQNIEDRYNQLTEKLMDPEVINDSNKLRDYSKEQSDIQPIVEKFRQYKEIRQQIDEAKTMLEEESDEDVMEMAQEELNELGSQIEPLEQEMKLLLVPKDPNDDKNVIMEIRGAAGGEEAALFAEIFTVCTHAMRKLVTGKPKSSMPMNLIWVVIKKSSL